MSVPDTSLTTLCFVDLDPDCGVPLPGAVKTLPCVQAPESCIAPHILWRTREGLALGPREVPPAQATRVDFCDPALLYRLRTSGRRQGIGKAVGLDKTRDSIQVCDATAGLGRDALVLAHLGCRVTLVERSPWVHALLEDGLRRARACGDPLVRAALERMQLVAGDARQLLEAGHLPGAEPPDVIYLDPMFPPRRKSARVKKDIGVLQQVLGPDTDLEELLALAFVVARRRVVVKRPPNQPDITGFSPDFCITGKAAHFAVYVKSSFSSTV